MKQALKTTINVGIAAAFGLTRDRIVWGHNLVGLEQHEDSVTVKFENGNTDTGSFVIGCDGLHSGTRIALFSKEEASFTGLVQVGFNYRGFS